MDPKQQLSSLDPKLREAYERVMSSSAANASTQTPANPTATPTPIQSGPTPGITPPMPVTASPTPTMGGTPPMPTMGASSSNPTPPSNSPSGSGPFATPGISPTPSPIGQTTAPTIPMPTVQMQPGTTIPSPMQSGQNGPGPTTPPTMDPKSTPVQPGSTGPIKVQFNAQTGPVQAGATPQSVAGKQAKKGVSPVLIIAAVLVFVVAWLVFWMKIFNFPIPFIG